MKNILKSLESNSSELRPGEVITTSWGFVRFDSFDHDGSARVTIKHNDKEIPGLLSFEGEIDIYVDGGLFRVANVDMLGHDFISISVSETPEFVAQEYGAPVDVSDIISADYDQLYKLAQQYIEA